MENHADVRTQLTELYRAAIAAVDPAMLVGRALEGSVPGSEEAAKLTQSAKRVFVLAIGKASYAMAAELHRRIGDRIVAGLAVTPELPEPPPPIPKFNIVAGGHPLPNESSRNAASAALELLRGVKKGALVIVALSGGASAMFAAPVDGVTLDDKIATTSALLRSGATIKELNCVRKHLSAVKGGNLVRATPEGARVVALILSDVPGDDIATIGSGLVVPDPSTFGDAVAILKRRGIWGKTPEGIREHLEKGIAGEIPETPKTGDPSFARVTNVIIGSNRTAVDAVAEEATRMGFSIERWRDLKGEADEIGRDLALHLAKINASRVCVLAGGEPTVTVRGRGRGGRAQQCALAMALEFSRIDPHARVGVLFAGTDGIDGPTDAAGAFAFADSVSCAEALGLDPDTASRRNDAYNLFAALDDLFKVGPTGTNVTDLMIGLVNY